MFPRKFALVGGIFMLAVGAFALIPQFVGSAENLPLLTVNDSYGLFMGLFAMNVLNKIAMIVLGLGGIYAASRPATSLPASIQFSRIVLFVTGAFAILGLFPATNTLYGYMPLFGNNVGLHAVFAILGAYFGYALSAKVPNVADEPVRRTMSTKDMSRPLSGVR